MSNEKSIQYLSSHNRSKSHKASFRGTSVDLPRVPTFRVGVKAPKVTAPNSFTQRNEDAMFQCLRLALVVKDWVYSAKGP